MRAAAPLALALLVACAGSAPAAEPTSTTPPPASTPMAELHALNEAARAGAVTETLHGVEIRDPYRALEEESELTRRWIAAQSARTAAALRPDAALRERLGELLRIGDLGDVDAAGERVFYSRREGEREQPLYVVREAGEEHVLIDPTTFGERAALDWAYPSPDGRLLAFGISDNGDERSTLHLLDVGARIADPTAGLRPLRIPRTKWCNLAWLPDGAGFYYTRYPKPGEPDYDPEHEDAYFPRVFFHRLGTPPEEDPRVWASEARTDFPIPSVSPDGRTLVLNDFRGWSASDVHVYDRRHGDVPSEAHPFVPVVTGEEALTSGWAHGDALWLHTNLDAPRYRLVRVPLARAGERDAWVEVLPERDAPLEGWTLVRGGLAAHYVEDIRSTLRLFDRDGGAEREVALPARGAIAGLAGEPDDPRVRFGFEGYLQPPSVLELALEDEGEPALRELTSVSAELDFDRYVAELEHVRSADGTRVPVTVLRPRDLPRDGSARAILYGYGGFNVSLLPGFRRSALAWLERGGVYAVANLRGGGELGEAWHRAGMRENKERVFEDFEAVIGWLAESGLSRPDRIGITGGSNGGLLMGAMITRVPERFAAAATYVDLYDMVRYHLFPPAELWVSEYGSAEEPTELAYLHAYSPYHRVRAGVRYPAVLVETADHDSRVHWAHSTKFAAALQEATSGEAPIYFLRAEAQGHGAGTRTSDLVDRYARMYSFFDAELD